MAATATLHAKLRAPPLPPPWSVDEAEPKLDRRCFIVRDANEQALAYVCFEEEPGQDQTRRW
jgi:hypothetical protein